MSWKKRSVATRIPQGRITPDYGACNSDFTVILHHHGKFKKNMTHYDGALTDYFDWCNVEMMSLIEVYEMVHMCGVDEKNVHCYYSKSGINCCRDLVKLENDSHALDMGYKAATFGDCISVFVEDINIDSQLEEGVHRAVEGVDAAESEEYDDSVNSDFNDGGDESEDDTPENEEDGAEIVQFNAENDGREEHNATNVERIDRELYMNLIDDREEFNVEYDDQSCGEDSVHSEGFYDSDSELTNENADFYKNVRVHQWLGGLDGKKYDSQALPMMTIPRNEVFKQREQYQGYPLFNPVADMDDPKFEVGLIFEGNSVLRQAIRNHSIKHGKELEWERNDESRFVVKCLGLGCTWRLVANAFRGKGKIAMQIKSLNGVHKCTRKEEVKAATATWIANQYEEEIKSIGKWKVKEMKSIIKSKKKVLVSDSKLYRAKKLVHLKKSGSEDYVDSCYKRSTYMKVYRSVMLPLRGQNEWPASDLPKLLPPIPEKMPGRPKNATRRKSTIEIQEVKAKLALQKAAETGRLGRHGMVMKCSYCKLPGHNKAGCVKRANESGESSAPKAKGKKEKCTHCKKIGHTFAECIMRIVDDETAEQEIGENMVASGPQVNSRKRQLFNEGGGPSKQPPKVPRKKRNENTTSNKDINAEENTEHGKRSKKQITTGTQESVLTQSKE